MSEWFYVPGFGETYVINPYGEVWSRDRTVMTSSGIERRYKGKKLAVRPDGYISLTKDGFSRQASIDVLVRETFGHRRLVPGTDEVWREIPGYSGRYEVSDFDRVRTREGEVLPSPGGVVSLQDDSGQWQDVDVRQARESAFTIVDGHARGDDLTLVWRPVPGFPGYEVNLARQVRRAGPGGRPIKVAQDVVHLSRDGKRFRRRASALAQAAFPDVYGQVGSAV